MKLALRLVAAALVLLAPAAASGAAQDGYLYVFNAASSAAMVSIDGAPAQAAAPGKPVVRQVRPGGHSIIVTRRAVQKSATLTVGAGNAWAGQGKPIWCAEARENGITLAAPPTCQTLISGG